MGGAAVQKTCLKCGHTAAADPKPMAECPRCGAIYLRVEEAMARAQQQAPKAPEEVGGLRRKLRAKSTLIGVLLLALALFSGAAYWIIPTSEQRQAARVLKAEQDERDAAAAVAEAERVRELTEYIAQQRSQKRSEPRRSEWDGAYYEVQRLLKRTAHDPSSIEMLPCTLAVETAAGWLTTCEFRGRNALGALVLERAQFVIKNGDAVQIGNR